MYEFGLHKIEESLAIAFRKNYRVSITRAHRRCDLPPSVVPVVRIRHPLYLAEAIATIGVLLLYRIPTAFALVAIQFCLQLWRMREE